MRQQRLRHLNEVTAWMQEGSAWRSLLSLDAQREVAEAIVTQAHVDLRCGRLSTIELAALCHAADERGAWFLVRHFQPRAAATARRIAAHNRIVGADADEVVETAASSEAVQTTSSPDPALRVPFEPFLPSGSGTEPSPASGTNNGEQASGDDGPSPCSSCTAAIPTTP
ncbi:MAG: hypothetical protein R2715_03535 [Ilumatobacteraceae bacterium]